jgi:hypothetical protein
VIFGAGIGSGLFAFVAQEMSVFAPCAFEHEQIAIGLAGGRLKVSHDQDCATSGARWTVNVRWTMC